MWVQYCVALTSCDRSIIPTLSAQHGSLHWLWSAVAMRRSHAIVSTVNWVRTASIGCVEILLKLLKVVPWYETDLSFLIAGFEPFWIGGGSVDNFQSIAFLEGQFRVIIWVEGVKSDHDVEDVLGHGISMKFIIVIFLGCVVAWEPSCTSVILPSPPS